MRESEPLEPSATRSTHRKAVRTSSQKKTYRTDLALIREVGFHLGLKRKRNEFFTTSLYKVDRLIEEKRGLRGSN